MGEAGQELGYLLRIGVVAFGMPVWVIITALFLWNQEFLYAGLMLAFISAMGYGTYTSTRRRDGDDGLDDAQMRRVNWKAGSKAFWTMFNVILLNEWVITPFAIGRGIVSSSWFDQFSALTYLGVGLFSYIGFRAYYLRHGPDSNPWRWIH